MQKHAVTYPDQIYVVQLLLVASYTIRKRFIYGGIDSRTATMLDISHRLLFTSEQYKSRMDMKLKEGYIFIDIYHSISITLQPSNICCFNGKSNRDITVHLSNVRIFKELAIC